MPREPANARQSRFTQPKNEHVAAFPFIAHLLVRASRYRSLRVDNPNSTSIIVMIQKRTTTWFSFQPFNS
jgi:hypothetical protein